MTFSTCELKPEAARQLERGQKITLLGNEVFVLEVDYQFTPEGLRTFLTAVDRDIWAWSDRGDSRFSPVELCQVFQVPLYLFGGPRPRQWGNPENFRRQEA